MTDVGVSDSARVGEVDQGWTVGTRWMFHEKNAMGGDSPYVTGTFHTGVVHAVDPIAELANATGRSDDPRTQELVGEAHMLTLARTALSARVSEGIRMGAMAETSVALARLIAAVVDQRRITIALDLAGANAAATLPGDPWAEEGFNFLERQVAGIGGGTTEMARNNIAERVLGMPARSPTTRACPFATCRAGRPLSLDPPI